MTEDEKGNGRGFAGLVDLVSNISNIDNLDGSDLNVKKRTSPGSESATSLPKETPHGEPKQKSASDSSIETIVDGENKQRSKGIWIIGAVVIMYVVWAINDAKQDNEEPSHNLVFPSSSDEYISKLTE